MPSSRRSQNLPLEDPLISSSTSRSKKPSDKAKAAKADAARKVNADVAARTIVEAAVKANTAGAAVKANCPRTSSIYRTAIQLGVPDGMTRSFRGDLKTFKPQWRQAKDLLHIGQA